MEFSRQEFWSRLSFPSPGEFPDPGIEPSSPELQADSLPTYNTNFKILFYNTLLYYKFFVFFYNTCICMVEALHCSPETTITLLIGYQFSSVQSLSHVQLFATPWIAACQASLSITNSRSSPRLTSIESVMPSSHLILCHPLLLLPPIPPSIGVFSNESTLRMRWPKYWSFSFSIIPSKEIPGLIS